LVGCWSSNKFIGLAIVIVNRQYGKYRPRQRPIKTKLFWVWFFVWMPLSGFAQEWQAVSETGIFHVTVAPENGHYMIGGYHHWTLTVKNKQYQPVTNAQIYMTGGMVGHGHGMPSQPLVTRYLGEGRYLIEGMLFNMAGEWTLLFSIQTAQEKDRVQIDIELTH
jgi:hypothetical protein